MSFSDQPFNFLLLHICHFLQIPQKHLFRGYKILLFGRPDTDILYEIGPNSLKIDHESVAIVNRFINILNAPYKA